MNTLCRYSCIMVKEEVVNAEIKDVSLDQPETLVNMLNAAVSLSSRPSEELWVIYLSAKLKVIGIEMVSRGGLTGSSAAPREVFGGAIRKGAYGIVAAHNHPSGDPAPSAEDIKSTKQLIKAGNILGVKLIDHIVIGDGSFISMRQSNLCKF